MIMKRVFVFLSSVLFLNSVSFCQTLEQEFHDIDNSNDLNNGKGFSNYDNLGSNLAWSESWIMMSYIRMYKATNDVYYLQKFVRHAFNVIHQRDDYKGYSNYAGETNPTWVSDADGDRVAWVMDHGMITYPMAEFVELVFSNPSLKSKKYSPANYDCSSAPWVSNSECLHNIYGQALLKTLL